MHLEPLKAEHIQDMGILPYGQDIGDFFRIADVKDSAFAGVEDGVIYGAGGIIPIRIGLGEAWLLLPNRSGRRSFDAFRLIQSKMREILKQWGYWRVECNIREDFYQGRRLARILGFQKESAMPGWGFNCETFIKMVWLDKEKIWQSHLQS